METNGLVFISGQGGVDSAGTFEESIEVQTRQTMENLKAILAEFGLDFSHVVKTGIFLIDMGEWVAMNKVYASYFEGDPPARTTIGVAALPVAEMKIEIDMVAAR